MAMSQAIKACAYPGCKRPPAEPTAATGRPPVYCDEPAHTRESAFAERARLRKDGKLPDVDPDQRPVSLASLTIDGAAQTLDSHVGALRELADRVEVAAATIADQTAVDLELDALRASCELDAARARADGFTAQQEVAAQLAAAQQQAQAGDAQLHAVRQELELLGGESAEQADQIAELQAQLSSERSHSAERLAAVETDRDERLAQSAEALSFAEADLQQTRTALADGARELGAALDRAAGAEQQLADTQAGVAEHETRARAVGEELAAERARRQTLQSTAVTAEQLVQAERGRAEEARASAGQARAERDRALTAAERVHAQLAELDKRLAVAQATAPKAKTSARAKSTSAPKPKPKASGDA